MTDVAGVVAAALTTACWIPQVRRTLRRGTASDFAWSYLAIYGIGLTMWLVYGLALGDPVISVSNALVLLSVVVLVAVKLRSKLVRVGHVEVVVPAGTDPVTALQSLREVGPRLAADLKAVGIPDPDSLRATGIEVANRRLVAAGLQTGVHSRKAIEAALASGGTIEGPWGTATFHPTSPDVTQPAATDPPDPETSGPVGDG